MDGRFERILLTGGAGFIGSHLAEALVRRGACLTVVDNLDPFYAPEWKRANLDELRRAGEFQLHETDIRQEAAMRRVFAAARPEAVIHLAARPGVRASIEEPRLYEQMNVAATLNLLELARESGVRQFVFASSSSVYGAISHMPFSENQSTLRPISPYGATKLAGELLCHTYAHLHRLPAICLRFFSVYGPRQRPDLAIHKFTSLIESGKPVPLFGDGSTGRDYTHVDDIVSGILAALEYHVQPKAGEAPFEVFNLGNSRPVKLNELVALLEAATGKRARREVLVPPPGDVPLTWADTRKAERLLGYRAEIQLPQGLAEFVAWFRERLASKGAAA
ncbi:MAG TPA: NAD-dependent epimerase/dehydratase family protein [Candidatus Acidoferrales bacterium]|nr:NAD-dependent epimerase/dehydratase family protein [Candidatus Acidoferrales bacterium]